MGYTSGEVEPERSVCSPQSVAPGEKSWNRNKKLKKITKLQGVEYFTKWMKHGKYHIVSSIAFEAIITTLPKYSKL